jgi:hypothetical protein
LIVPGGLLFAAGSLLVLLTASTTANFLGLWLPAAILTGTGVALIIPILSSAAVHYLPPQKLAVGSGVNQAVRQFGTVLGVSITFVILGSAPSALPLFQHLFGLMVGGGLAVSAIGMGIDTRPVPGETPMPLAHPIGFD